MAHRPSLSSEFVCDADRGEFRRHRLRARLAAVVDSGPDDRDRGGCVAHEFRVGNPETHHTAMLVRDLEAAVRFYTEVLGMKVRSVQGDPERPRAVFLPAIQLVRAAEQDTSEKGVLHHIGVSVANLDELVENLQAAGVPLEGSVNDLTQPGGPRVRTAFFLDPECNRIELVERAG